MIKGLKGVENIYTQHSPLLKEIVEELTKNRLKTSSFPYCGTVQLNEKPREMIVFVIGGVTYEESLAIHNFNRTLPGVKIIMGSTCIHNFRSFVDEIQSATNVISGGSASQYSWNDWWSIVPATIPGTSYVECTLFDEDESTY